VTACLLDTCVIIDYLRDRQEAIKYMRRQDARPAVSAITAAELFAGVRSSAEEHRIEALCGHLLIRHVDLEIARLAGSYCRRYKDADGVQISDALIAATARIHRARLVTRNTRHFPMLDDVIVAHRLN
jgi:predicted nucleic acid-binding protein